MGVVLLSYIPFLSFIYENERLRGEESEELDILNATFSRFVLCLIKLMSGTKVLHTQLPIFLVIYQVPLEGRSGLFLI